MCLNYPKGKRKISVILAILSGGHATVAIVLQALKIMYLNDTMAFNLFMYICAGINIFAYYMKYKKDSFSLTKQTKIHLFQKKPYFSSVFYQKNIIFAALRKEKPKNHI
jgi:hypothetical protein